MLLAVVVVAVAAAVVIVLVLLIVVVVVIAVLDASTSISLTLSGNKSAIHNITLKIITYKHSNRHCHHHITQVNMEEQ